MKVTIVAGVFVGLFLSSCQKQQDTSSSKEKTKQLEAELTQLKATAKQPGLKKLAESHAS